MCCTRWWWKRRRRRRRRYNICFLAIGAPVATPPITFNWNGQLIVSFPFYQFIILLHHHTIHCWFDSSSTAALVAAVTYLLRVYLSVRWLLVKAHHVLPSTIESIRRDIVCEGIVFYGLAIPHHPSTGEYELWWIPSIAVEFINSQLIYFSMCRWLT